MRLLWVATKAPWPPADGGRLLLHESLSALEGVGRGGAAPIQPIQVTLVAPVAPAAYVETEAALRHFCTPRLVAIRPSSRWVAVLSSALSGRPFSVVRHDRRPVARAVARELAAQPFDLVVAEQLQAFASTAAARAAGRPRLLRAQNVESDLWRQLAVRSSGLRRTFFRREAERLARAERRAIGEAALTLALSGEDAAQLGALGPSGASVEVLPPPFSARLEPASRPLAGSPALVLFGSAGWEPNRRGERRFVEEIWPGIAATLPGARLHRFGGEHGGAKGERVEAHPSPATSGEAFAPGSILVLPLDIASGVRMRILEAWARGVAVVASRAAASGLEVTDGEELLLADEPAEFVASIARLAASPELVHRLVEGGRARLAAEHNPARFAERFRELAARRIGAEPGE